MGAIVELPCQQMESNQLRTGRNFDYVGADNLEADKAVQDLQQFLAGRDCSVE